MLTSSAIGRGEAIPPDLFLSVFFGGIVVTLGLLFAAIAFGIVSAFVFDAD